MNPAIQTGHDRAEACAEKARQEVENWPELAAYWLHVYANVMRGQGAWSGEHAVDFVLRQPGMVPPHDQRAFGAVFLRLSRRGIIKRSGVLFPREKGHGSATPGWETTIALFHPSPTTTAADGETSKGVSGIPPYTNPNKVTGDLSKPTDEADLFGPRPSLQGAGTW